MVSKKLFVGWIPYSFSNEDLKNLFSSHGEIVYARVLTDKDTWKSRGFGFVLFENVDDAVKAKEELHKHEVKDRFIIVDYSEEN